MVVTVSFYSWFKELTGCRQITATLAEGETLADLVQKLVVRFPNLSAMQRSMLMAVGVDYADPKHALKDGDEVSLFPPVQGG